MKFQSCLTDLAVLAVQLIVCTMGVILLLLLMFFIHQVTTEYALPHPIPMPDLPAELMNLPTQARVGCLGPIAPDRAKITNQDFINVWTQSGNSPRRPDDSAGTPPGSIKGPRLGRILRCTEVMATKINWSEFDGEFYVWARAVERPIPDEDRKFWQWIESEQAAGWVRFSHLDFR